MSQAGTYTKGAVAISGGGGGGGVTSTVTVTSAVAAAAVSQTLIVANLARKGVSIANRSVAAVLFIRVNAGAASAMDYTIRLPPNAYFECPFGYLGAVTGIWDIAEVGAAAQMTEYT